jgi:hypothetical protein
MENALLQENLIAEVRRKGSGFKYDWKDKEFVTRMAAAGNVK